MLIKLKIILDFYFQVCYISGIVINGSLQHEQG